MWKWLKNLFGDSDQQVQVEVYPPVPEPEDDDIEVMDSHPYRTPAEVISAAKPEIPKTEEPTLIGILKDAAREVADERVKLEHNLFTIEKMKVYFQKAMKCILTNLDGDSYDFVLIHASTIGIPDKGLPLFSQIFVKACKELGINAEINSTYVKVDKPGVRKLLEKIPTSMPRVNIDEKVRQMLGR